MGDEILQRHFNAEDFTVFRRNLDAETARVESLFNAGAFSQRGDITGFELEAWIVDSAGNPSPTNAALLDDVDNPLVVPELAAFNVELNGSPTSVSGNVFTRIHDELAATWAACQASAEHLGCQLATIGILPTITPDLLNSDQMSKMVRYQALNDRVMALRDGAPLDIELRGTDELRMRHSDVMLEAATTSFQIHLQCKPERAVRDFNAAMVASAPIVALAANAPYLFGKSLWCETRIPLFEQAVAVGARNPKRVSFGTGYAEETLFEIFLENQRDHPILIPFVQRDEPPSKYAHVRFQNGTVWRWNRPLLGFDFDGQPHLRIENRVVPAGPTIADSVANAAIFLGLVRGLVEQAPIEDDITFADAERNFYECARLGLDAEIVWRGGPINVRSLVQNELIPLAAGALEAIDIPASEVAHYIGIIEGRVETGQTGAAWQRTWIDTHCSANPDFHALTLAYIKHQNSGEAVHTWTLD